MSSRFTRFGLRTLAVILGLCVALLLGEITLRLLARHAGRPHDSDVERARLESIVSGEKQYNPSFRGTLPGLSEGKQDGPVGPEAQALRLLHPYTGWETAPGMDLTARLLGPEGVPAADPHAYRILIVGGSVAAMFARLGAERFVERLAQDPRLAGRRPEVLAFGRTGFKEPQQLMMIAWLFTLGVVPDVVLDLDGHNEVSVGNENASRGTNPLYPSIPHWGSLALSGGLDRDLIRMAARSLDVRDLLIERADQALRWHLYDTEIGCALARSRLGGLQAEQRSLHESFFAGLTRASNSVVLHGPPFDADQNHVIAQTVDGWERDSLMINALCAARGVLFLHVLQPALYDPSGKTPTERELETGHVLDAWKAGVEIGYPLLRTAGQRLKERGVHFVDASNVFIGVEGDVFVDSCHFAERGNEILADRMAKELLLVMP